MCCCGGVEGEQDTAGSAHCIHFSEDTLRRIPKKKNLKALSVHRSFYPDGGEEIVLAASAPPPTRILQCGAHTGLLSPELQGCLHFCQPHWENTYFRNDPPSHSHSMTPNIEVQNSPPPLHSWSLVLIVLTSRGD